MPGGQRERKKELAIHKRNTRQHLSTLAQFYCFHHRARRWTVAATHSRTLVFGSTTNRRSARGGRDERTPARFPGPVSLTRNAILPLLVQLNMGRGFWKTSAAVVDSAEERQKKSAFFFWRNVPTAWRRSVYKKSCAFWAWDHLSCKQASDELAQRSKYFLLWRLCLRQALIPKRIQLLNSKRRSCERNILTLASICPNRTTAPAWFPPPGPVLFPPHSFLFAPGLFFLAGWCGLVRPCL